MNCSQFAVWFGLLTLKRLRDNYVPFGDEADALSGMIRTP